MRKDKAFQHLKNIEALAAKELEFLKEEMKRLKKSTGNVICEFPPNDRITQIWNEAQKGMIALDPMRYEGGEDK